MNLYEVVNGWTGESYVRAYAWAKDEQQALELVREQYRKVKGGANVEDYLARLDANLLFSSDAAPFATILDSSGWLTETYPDRD